MSRANGCLDSQGMNIVYSETENCFGFGVKSDTLGPFTVTKFIENWIAIQKSIFFPPVHTWGATLPVARTKSLNSCCANNLCLLLSMGWVKNLEVNLEVTQHRAN